MAERSLADYLQRPMSPPDALTLRAIEAGPLDGALALQRERMDDLLEPAELPAETGWCTLADGVGYVAVRTAMPGVSGEMVDWWFDWHPRDPLRYRIWHPRAHRENSLQEPARPGARPHWGAVHHPVEDIGLGVVRARIEFLAPSAIGFSGDFLEDPRVAAIVCGYAGDDRLRVRHTPMVHAFLNDGEGVVLRSRFWLGAALRPYGPLGGLGEALMNRPLVRSRAMPAGVPRALARHCAEEYANLAALLPELYGRFGPGS